MWLLAVIACHSSSGGSCQMESAWADEDGDGFGDRSHQAGVCLGAPGYVSNSDDCDDQDPAVHPGVVETCNGQDDDCDGNADTMGVWYADADGDGYGAGAKQLACTAPEDAVREAGDCDDGDASIHPGATEICNAIDDDCDGTDDNGFDVDADGHLSSADCATGDDCDDTDPTVYEGAPELCGDGRDNDCADGDVPCGLSGEYSLDGADAKIYGTESGEEMARQIQVGDVDGDGTLDVLLASEGAISWRGGGHVAYGPIAGTHDVDEIGFEAYGSADISAAGRSIGIGDVNADGYADVEFGAPYSNEAFVEFGPVTADFDLADSSLHYDGADVFGHGSDLADVDADGVEDVIVGAFTYSGGAPYAGAVFIDFGPVTGGNIRMLDDYDVKLFGSEVSLEAGRVIAAGKDMDGDGIGDMMIQAMGYSGGAPNGGGVAVAHGPFPDNLDLADADAFLIGDSPYASAGSAVAQGDVDGDGTADALVGAPIAGAGKGTPTGEAFVVAGATTGVVDLVDADVVIHGTNAGYLGMALAAGDIDGDTRPELFVGASWERDWIGVVHLFYGAMPGTWADVDADAKFVGTATGGQAGMALAVADLDANGLPDLLIGAPVESSKSVQWGGALFVVMSY
jgi:hypothetical protein